MCGREINKLTPKAQLLDGYICNTCFNKAGFTFNERSIENVKSVTYAQFIAHSRKILGDDYPDWNNPEYVLRAIRKNITHPNITLKKDEICAFQTNAEIGKKKTRTINKGRKQYKETYYEKTPCTFYMTTNRFIATVPQGNGFIIKAESVIAISMHSDALEINNNGKSVIVFMSPAELNRFKTTVDLFKQLRVLGIDEGEIMNPQRRKTVEQKAEDIVIEMTVADTEKAAPKQKTATEVTKTDNKGKRTEGKTGIDPVAEIRRYKALLDDGIITQEEFDKKKQQLLSI